MHCQLDLRLSRKKVSTYPKFEVSLSVQSQFGFRFLSFSISLCSKLQYFLFAVVNIMLLCHYIQVSSLVPVSHTVLKPLMSWKLMARQEGKANRRRENTRRFHTTGGSSGVSLWHKPSTGSMFVIKPVIRSEEWCMQSNLRKYFRPNILLRRQTYLA